MKFKIRIAEMVIEIEHIYPKVRTYCQDYITEEGEPELYVRTTEELIQREHQTTEEEQEVTYSPDYLETLAVLRQISDQIPQKNRFLMHGAVIAWHGKAYMFTAPSGTGKSTHIRLWRKYLGSDVHVINGDKPLLKVGEKETIAYGTPWAGKEQWQENASAPLAGICILKRGTENRIRKVPAEEALIWILRQIYFTEDEDSAGRVMELADQLLAQAPVYELECDMSENAVQCSFEMMTGERYEKVFRTMCLCIRNVVCAERVTLPELSETEQKQLYALSVRQDVAHIVSMALEWAGKMPQGELGERLKQQENLALYRYMNQDYALQEIGEVFTEKQIPFLPLKGAVLRAEYPEPWLRTSGDIDILVHEQDVKRASQVLMETCGFSREGGDKKDISFMRDECVHVELHLNLIRTNLIQALQTKEIWAHAVKSESGYRYEMADEDFYAFHIEHMKNHFCTGGCGVRFFLDMWVLNHCRKFDETKRVEKLRACGLETFEAAATELMNVWFGTGRYTELTDQMQQFILSAGVYGTIDNWALIQEIQNEGKAKSIWKRLWLPYEDLCWSYPALQGRRYLQPWFEAKRFWKMIADGRWNRTVTELKANRSVDQETRQKIRGMLDDLNLADGQWGDVLKK